MTSHAVAVTVLTLCAVSGARADDTPSSTSPPPPEPAAAPDAAPPTEAPAPTDAELKALADSLNADAPPGNDNKLKAAGVPDLSTVNVAAALPQMLQSMNPDMAIVFDAAAAGFSGKPLQTGGHDPTHNGFNLRQVELSMGASVDPYLRFDTNIVFKDSVEVEEAYATTLGLPWNLQVRAGEFLSHVGRINLQHPHAWSFVDQPLVYGKFMGEDNHRGLGVEVNWLAPLPWSLTLYGAVQQTGGACCSRTFSPVPDVEAIVNNPLDLVATGTLEQFFALGDDVSLLWGLSSQAGPAQYLGAQGRAEIQLTDVLLRYRPVVSETRWWLELQAEAMVRTRHNASTLLVDEGAYAHLVWRISPEWELGARYDYVQGIAHDALDDSGLGPQVQRATGQLTYYPSHFSRLRLEASVGDRHDGTPPITAVMLDLEVNIGAHGAHTY